MDHTGSAEALLSVAAALAVALVLTPLVRSVTVGLDSTLGQAWPFSLTRCHVRATPGCNAVATGRLQASR